MSTFYSNVSKLSHSKLYRIPCLYHRSLTWNSLYEVLCDTGCYSWHSLIWTCPTKCTLTLLYLQRILKASVYFSPANILLLSKNTSSELEVQLSNYEPRIIRVFGRLWNSSVNDRSEIFKGQTKAFNGHTNIYKPYWVNVTNNNLTMISTFIRHEVRVQLYF